MPDNMTDQTPDGSQSYLKNMYLLMLDMLKESDVPGIAQTLGSIIRMDKQGSYSDKIATFFDKARATLGAGKAFNILSDSAKPAAQQNSHYTGLVQRFIASYMYDNELSPEEQAQAALDTLDSAGENEGARKIAAARLIEICESNLIDEAHTNYFLARRAMLESTKDTHLHKKSIELWEHFLKATEEMDNVDQANYVARKLPNDDPTQKKALAFWEEELKQARQENSYSYGLRLIKDTITDPAMPDMFVEKAIEHWNDWQKNLLANEASRKAFVKTASEITNKLKTSSVARKDSVAKSRSGETLSKIETFKENLNHLLLRYSQSAPDKKPPPKGSGTPSP